MKKLKFFKKNREARYAVAYRWLGEEKVEIEILPAMGIVTMKADPQIEILAISEKI